MNIDPNFTLAGHLPTAIGVCDLPEHFVHSKHIASDRAGMSLALRWAMRSSGMTEPNPAVGCVVVAAGLVIAGGSTLAAGDLHAERVALDCVPRGLDLRNATLYTTLEPCAHTGKQPPCCDAVVAAGIGRCVIGTRDTDQRVDGRGIQILAQAGLRIQTEIMQAESAMWHLPFLLRAKLDRPFVALKWAQTLDGQLAYDAGRPQWITGAVANRYAHWLRQRYDALVVGAGTAIHDLARLNVRHVPGRKHRDPIRIIADPNGRLLKAEGWNQILGASLSAAGSVIYIGPRRITADEGDRLAQLETQGNVLVRQYEPRHSLVQSILEIARDPEVEFRFHRSINSLMVEGGPRLHRLFLDAGVADAAHLLVAPGFGSGSKHRVAPDWQPDRRLTVTGSYRLGNDVLIEMVGPEAAQLIEAGTNVGTNIPMTSALERTK